MMMQNYLENAKEKKSGIKNQTLKEYTDVLINGKQKRHNMNTITSNIHNIYSVSVTKTSLSNFVRRKVPNR